MDLADILGREQIVPELKATNRWEAIDELIGNLVATGKIQPGDRDAVTAAAWPLVTGYRSVSQGAGPMATTGTPGLNARTASAQRVR